MDYKDLQVFLAASDHLHLGRASTLLHMSASTLSRRLTRMEEELGVTLMLRDSTPMQLTAAGVRFAQYAEQALASWRQLKHSLTTEVSDLSGSLTLYCSVTASYSFLSELVARFREQYPKVDLRIHTGDAADSISRVVAHEADVVIAARPQRLPQELVFKAMASSPLLFIAPRNLNLVPALVSAEVDWERVPMVLSETGLARVRVGQWFASKGIEPHIYAQVTGNEAIVSMVALGVGVGVVPEIVLRNSPMANRVRILAVQPELEPFAIGLCALNQRLQEPLIRALWQTAAI